MPGHYGKGKKKRGGKKKKGGMGKGLTAKQMKLPAALRAAILKKKRGKK